MTAGCLLLAGCAKHVIDLDSQAACGTITTRPGRPGLVVAAPHGTSDVRTDQIAAEIARRTGFGLVVATGRPPSEDTTSDDARRVCEGYERRVREIAQGPLRFYAEIHGNNRPESAGRIEIATVGMDREYALRLRTLAELIRDAHLRGHREVPRLDVLVEPADAVRYAATVAKREGILRLPERALHIELPRAARTEFPDVYTAILADFLAQAVTLPVGR